jgi:hypothetical protein
VRGAASGDTAFMIQNKCSIVKAEIPYAPGNSWVTILLKPAMPDLRKRGMETAEAGCATSGCSITHRLLPPSFAASEEYSAFAEMQVGLQNRLHNRCPFGITFSVRMQAVKAVQTAIRFAVRSEELNRQVNEMQTGI